MPNTTPTNPSVSTERMAIVKPASVTASARANAVKNSLVSYASQKSVNLDVSQMQPVGAGILEPIIPKPRNAKEARENMRVEFRVMRIPTEALKDSEFDF